MNRLKIAITSDHAGYELKTKLIDYLNEKGFEIDDLGCYSSKSVDYPDFGHKIAAYVAGSKSTSYGISLCGSGNGINMTANKHAEIRSALCWNPEIAALARKHNDANICSLPARFITFEQATRIIDRFLTESFEGGRHLKRKNKIPI